MEVKGRAKDEVRDLEKWQKMRQQLLTILSQSVVAGDMTSVASVQYEVI